MIVLWATGLLAVYLCSVALPWTIFVRWGPTPGVVTALIFAAPWLAVVRSRPAEFNLAMTGLIDRLNPEIKPKPKKGKKKKPYFNPSPCAFCNQPMGGEEFGMFDISVDLGSGDPIRLGSWAHLACLNAKLHPAHIVQAWKTSPEEIQAEVDRLLGGD